MDFQDYIGIARKWAWLLVACVLVSSVSAYVGTLRMPRMYEATVTVIVGQTLQQPDPSTQDIYISQQLAQTYAEMVKRRPILEGAAQALGLRFVPSREDISTRQVPGTQLLEISVRDTVPERSAALANEIARQLVLQSPAMSQGQERRAFVQERLEALEKDISETEAEVDAEQQKLDAANSARAIQQHQANIAALQQKLASYESTYASLLAASQGGVNTVSVIEPATVPDRPISPRVPETVALAGAVGLALGVGGVALIEALDDTVKSPEEAVELSGGLPLLATIAEMESKDYPEMLVAEREPLSPITESYRVLRTNVQFAALDQPLDMLMVASPGPSEGKSVTLANLGVVLAQSGQKVILVDTDLRRPVLHKLFGLENKQGFCEAILNLTDGVMAYVSPTKVENLYLMTSGALPPNPAEVLGSDRALQLLEMLKTQADVVLLDSPPVMVVADAVVLGARVDGVLLVTDIGATRRAMARRAVEELARARARVLGLVANRLPTKRGGGYYYQYAYYYYYYYADDKRRRRPHRQRRSTSFRWLAGLLGRNSRGDHGVQQPASTHHQSTREE